MAATCAAGQPIPAGIRIDTFYDVAHALMPPRCQLVQAFGFYPEGQKAKDALKRVNALP